MCDHAAFHCALGRSSVHAATLIDQVAALADLQRARGNAVRRAGFDRFWKFASGHVSDGLV
jgi:hypothetical protein